MKGITYDSTRKIAPVQICKTPKSGDTKAVYTQYTPVPYNLDFELSIISKNNDDSVQILEQILPYFQPMFNISINLIEQTNETKDIPIILQNVNIQDDYEGDFKKRRSLIHTLNFVAKTYLYGPVATQDVIKTINVDIGTAINTGSRYIRYSATPDALQDYTNDGTDIPFSNINVNSNTITLVNHGFISEDFVTYRVTVDSGEPIEGLESNSEYYIIKIDNDNFRLASTKYNAQRLLSVPLTTQGTGPHKFSIINTTDDQFVEPEDNFGFNETWSEL